MKPRRKSTRVTIADVAAAAGVSIMTVSRVVNRDEKVKATTRKTVEEAIAALNYAPNVAARTLAGGRIKRICLLYGNPSSAYLGELLVGALEAASEAGAHLIVERTDASLDPSLLAQHFGRDWDALIVPPPMSDIAGIRQTIQAHAFPAVFIASARETSESAEIRIDDTEAAREMTQYLIEQGHQRIGFIKGATDQTVSAARYDGYRQALIEAGIDIDVTLVRTGQFTYRSGLDATRALLQLAERPTAIFASNDDMAAGGLAAAAQAGISVPDQLSIAGFDDSSLANVVWPPLTTVRQPVSEMAALAVRHLVSAREDEQVAPYDTLAHVIVTRGSTSRSSDAD